MTSERDSTPSDVQRDQLGDAVTAEERLLDRAPSLAEDGPRVRHDADEGPTAATMLTSSQILEAEELAPRLGNLERKTDGVLPGDV